MEQMRSQNRRWAYGHSDEARNATTNVDDDDHDYVVDDDDGSGDDKDNKYSNI